VEHVLTVTQDGRLLSPAGGPKRTLARTTGLVITFFVVAIAILVGAMGLSGRSIIDLISVDKLYVERSAALISLQEIKSTMLAAVIAERNFILTGKDTDLQPYVRAKAEIWLSLGRRGNSCRWFAEYID
jgi:CHASE3 domain sensor protein